MKIECLRIRDGGTKVTLDDKEYHFAPQPDGRHIAEVNATAHIKTLLAIDAYAIADSNVADMVNPKSVTEASAPTDPSEPTEATEASAPSAASDPGDAVLSVDDLTTEQLRVAYEATLEKAAGKMSRAKLVAALEAAGYKPTAA